MAPSRTPTSRLRPSMTSASAARGAEMLGARTERFRQVVRRSSGHRGQIVSRTRPKRMSRPNSRLDRNSARHRSRVVDVEACRSATAAWSAAAATPIWARRPRLRKPQTCIDEDEREHEEAADPLGRGRAEFERRRFDPDQHVVFLVLMGIDRVIGKRPGRCRRDRGAGPPGRDRRESRSSRRGRPQLKARPRNTCGQ